jgi:hypothetical protein
MKSVTFRVFAVLVLLPMSIFGGRFDPGIDRIPLPILRRRKAPFFSGIENTNQINSVSKKFRTVILVSKVQQRTTLIEIVVVAA